MLSGPAYLPLVSLNYDGTLTISVPVKCIGIATDARVIVAVYEAALWGTPGTPINAYYEDLHFESGEEKTVSFQHTPVKGTTEGRDVGVTIEVEGEPVYSNLFQDLFSYGDGGGGGGILEMMMPIMMLMMVMPMMTGMMGDETGSDAEAIM